MRSCLLMTPRMGISQVRGKPACSVWHMGTPPGEAGRPVKVKILSKNPDLGLHS